MGWNEGIPSVIEVVGSPAGIFIYTPSQGPGNLIGSWASAAGTDAFGNSYPTGINVSQGILNGVLLNFPSIIGGTILNAIINGPQIQAAAISAGSITETAITFDSSGGSLLAYASSKTTVTQSTAGNYQITFPAGVTTALVQCWGADAGGGGGSSAEGGEGSGAGEYSAEPNYAVNSTQTFFYTVGAAGTPGVTGSPGTGGGDSFFDGTGVFANGGDGSVTPFVGGLGGQGSVNSVHFNGGNGGNGTNGVTASAGGGGRAGSTGPGGNGTSPSSNSVPGVGGTAGTGTGGHAGGAGVVAATNGISPAGGAGAGSGVTNISKQYHLNGGNSYFGSDANSGAPPNGIRSSNSSLYQGGETASGGSFNGTQKSMGLWPFSQIQSDLSGATIDSVTLRLENLHSWYNSGMSVALGYTNNSSLPSSFNGSSTNLGTFSIGEGATKTFNLPTSYGTALQGGTGKTIVIGPGSGSFNLNYYGYFYGSGGDNNQNPMLTIKAHTGAGAETGGAGVDGQVSITYTSGNVLQASLSPIAFTDIFGNNVPAGLGQLTPSGQYAKVSAAATDTTSRTCTLTTQTQMTALWSIPAGDAKVGTIYRLSAWGSGTTGTTVEQLDGFLFLNGSSGTAINNTNMNLTGTAIPVSTGFHWYYQINVVIQTTGTGGTCTTGGLWTISEAVSTTDTNAETSSMSSTGQVFNTTIANTLGLFMVWAAGPAASTITCFGSMLERMGP